MPKPRRHQSLRLSLSSSTQLFGRTAARATRPRHHLRRPRRPAAASFLESHVTLQIPEDKHMPRSLQDRAFYRGRAVITYASFTSLQNTARLTAANFGSCLYTVKLCIYFNEVLQLHALHSRKCKWWCAEMPCELETDLDLKIRYAKSKHYSCPRSKGFQKEQFCRPS